MTDVTVEPFTGEGQEWDAFVRNAPGWTHFHLYGWRGLVEQVHGHECPYLGARDAQGTLVGVLPLVRVRSLLFGHYLASMPFLNYGGPLGSKSAVQALAAYVRELADRGKVKLAEFRCLEPAPLDWDVSHRKITVVLDIPTEGSDGMWSQFKPKLRSQIRRPEKAGVEVRFGVDQRDGFYQVFARHMRDLGTPVQGRALFKAIGEVFGDSAWFGCAYHDGKPVAGGAGFVWGDEFEMTWASSLREASRIAPNMLLYWSFLKRAAAQGLSRFNFGRCTPGGGTHRFKSQWGARDVPLYWYQYARRGAAATPSPDQGVYALGPRLWRHIPVPIATALGSRIVSGIP